MPTAHKTQDGLDSRVHDKPNLDFPTEALPQCSGLERKRREIK